MDYLIDLCTPWTLHFDRNGTEDIAVICNAEMDDLATSREFWLPEGDDPTPTTLAAFRLMTAAPDLLNALSYLLEQTVQMDLKHGIVLSEGEEDAMRKALLTIASATGKQVAQVRHGR